MRSLLLALDCSCDHGTAPEADKEADWSMMHPCMSCPHAATLRHWSLRQERVVTWVMMMMWSLMSSDGYLGDGDVVELNVLGWLLG